MKEILFENNEGNANYLSQLSCNLKNDISKHYQQANEAGCTDIIWTNEGLYLLNSVEEYTRLYDLFAPHSDEIICVICFREIEAFKLSYKKQLEKQGIPFSEDQDSYKYIKNNSWLFNYKYKNKILKAVFGENIHSLNYDPVNMIMNFMDTLGYPVSDDKGLRLNISR